jgi:phthiocerol/phenolphthiocerol synthesis type-I polyketide synthase E
MTADTVMAQITIAEDDTARELARIWEQLLGVESIGLDQNYFDLGGDSSLAVQLFAQIENVFGVKLPLATLFEAPTVNELARILHRETAPSNWSSLVAIQPAGSRPPLFCMHPHGGNVLIYRDLSRHLGSDQPFYGLQSQGLDGRCPPLTRIEDMAAKYVKEIRRVQPHGPYFLGGYCMGGAIALEVAQQLRAAGEPIALLALFDTINGSRVRPLSIWDETYHLCQRFAFHIANFLSLDSPSKANFFSEKMSSLRSRLPVWGSMLLSKLRMNSGETAFESQVLGQLWEANERAYLSYIPRPYPGKVTDFRPLKQYRGLHDPEMKWDRLAEGGQEVVVLPVNAPSVLFEPFVKHLAVALRRSMDTMLSTPERHEEGVRSVKSVNPGSLVQNDPGETCRVPVSA